ncbi:MAG: radical SAM protein [Oligoflexia bacterium]|nr:radical SAM protein [Oligoflexia bacterium]
MKVIFAYLCRIKSLASLTLERCGRKFILDLFRYNFIGKTNNIFKILFCFAFNNGRFSYNPTFLPPTVIIEITNRCNLKCNTCILGTSDKYSGYNKKDMGIDQFKNIIDSIPTLVHVWMQGVGEPLLNDSLIEMISYAGKKGIRSSFNTNGLLFNQTIMAMLISLKTHEIFFSINTLNEEKFRKYKSNADLVKIKDNLQTFISMRNDKKSKYPIIGIRAILMKDTIEDIYDLLNYGAMIGVDKISIQSYLVGFGDKGNDNQKIDSAEEKRITNLLIEHGRKLNISVVFDTSGSENGSCIQPWLCPFISAEGFVMPCCSVISPAKINFGNLSNKPFVEIWKDRRLNSLRENFYKQRPIICKNCSLY